MEYDDFLQEKKRVDRSTGIDVNRSDINNELFDFQKDVVVQALNVGKFAVFADCGLGKTPIQLFWAYNVHRYTDDPIIILAPLAVTHQTKREADKFDIDCPYRVVEKPEDLVNGINITNYEKLSKFYNSSFSGVVLDESSILKDYTGKTRNQIIDRFRETNFKLACSATPAPNDYMELSNHSEFLDVMDRDEFLATFFVHDSSETQQWRLKKHSQEHFWRWMTGWAVALSDPSDLGYENKRFELPNINRHEIVVDPDIEQGKDDGNLFRVPDSGIRGIQKEQRMTLEDRCKKARDIINDKGGSPWLVWCNRNDESEMLSTIIDGAVEIKGSHGSGTKKERMLKFSEGEIDVLVTKPSIAGHGMNWQHCDNMVFVGLTHSYEQKYQAERRCWRYGQENEVDSYVITTPNESSVVISVESKRKRDNEMKRSMIKASKNTWVEGESPELLDEKDSCIREGEGWRMERGDCVKRIRNIDNNSVGFTLFSPPFSSLYTYSDAVEDMGNTKDDEEFFDQFSFLVEELMRVTMPGRNVGVHLSNLTTTKAFDGRIGLRDFRGRMIQAFKDKDWIYHSEVCIKKDPVIAMQRTKAHGLLYKTLKKAAAKVRQGLADYLLVFRKEGENPKPIENTEESFPLKKWQKWANPVWDDIEQGNVLSNYRNAREKEDEKHICPLQLDLIERALKLWSAKNDIILDPFAGIGSVGYVSRQLSRKFIGIELKDSYWSTACLNLKQASGELQKKMF